MRKIYALILLCIVFSCEKTKESSTDIAPQEDTSEALTESDISKLKYTEYVLDSDTKIITDEWEEFNQLEEQIGYIKKGDLSYFSDESEAKKSLFKGLYDNIPEDINENSIIARIKALETKIYKLEDLANLSTSTQTDLLSGIKELLIAKSNLDLQMYKII